MRQTYDSRLRNAIARNGNSALVAKVIQLEFELVQERAKVVLLKSAQVTPGFSMQYVRVATAELKTKLLQHSEHVRQQRKVANLRFSCGACPV